MGMNRIVLIVVLLVLAGGCTVGPDYRRPQVDAPAGWRLADQEARDLADTAWWRQFGDPVLDGLIEEALRQNLDLRLAAARVEQYAGRYGATRADLFPQVGAGAEYSRARVTEVSTQG